MSIHKALAIYSQKEYNSRINPKDHDMTDYSAPATGKPSPLMGVFIGRFQPFHVGHHHVVVQALEHVSHLLVLVGSANRPRTSRNPFTAPERAAMIMASLTPEQASRVSVIPLPDSCDELPVWVENVSAQAQMIYARQFPNEAANITLVGHKKDNTSFYLDLFPFWTSLDVVGLPADEGHILSATPLRNALLGSASFWDDLLEHDPRIKVQPFLAQAAERYRPHALAWLDSNPAGVLPETIPHLRQFVCSDAFEEPCREAAYARHYRFPWRHSPYPPMFITADPVVFHDGHVLLIRRADYPGRGLWAIPGGFVEESEYLLEAALRELDEETSLGMDRNQLREMCFFHKVYDDPHRSVRGRVVDHAFGFRLPKDMPRPPAKINEESLDMDWVHISKLRSEDCFEDHFSIVHRMYKIMQQKS